MSAERRLIEVEEIRAGDRLRMEQRGYVPGSFVASATEFTALGDGAVNFGMRHWEDFDLVLLERPVKLPTRPYSLVVPPATERNYRCAYVLEPNGDGSLNGWYQAGSAEMRERSEVEERLAEGWRVIEGPEVIS